jgi:hypothetical protein
MARSAPLAVAVVVLLAFAGATPATSGGIQPMGDAGTAGELGEVGVESELGEVGVESELEGVGTASELGEVESASEPGITPSISRQDDPPNETTTDEVSDDQTIEIETDGFDPEYDPAEVLRRVEALRNLSATQGITIHEFDEDESATYDMQDKFGGIRPAGARTLQLFSNDSTEKRQPLGYTVEREAAVHIYLMNASDVEQYGVTQEVVLAHEFVHALQFQHELLTPSRKHLRSHFSRWTTDSRLVTTALIEGDAMTVTEQYFERYATQGNYSVSDYNRSLDRAAWPHSVAGLPYYYGYEFYEETGDSPEARSAALERPPNATADLLHPDESVAPAPLPGPLLPAEEDNLTRFHADTVGELVVRHTLRLNGLSFDRSVEIAKGWANDRMDYYAAEGASGPVTHWVTVWDDESEAREFADGWRAMLDENGAVPVGDTFRVPATDESPAVYYSIEREGDVVRITAGPSEELVERLAGVA